MKKLLLSTMMLAAGLFAATAAETTITFSENGYANGDEVTSVTTTEGNIAVTFAKGEGTATPKYYTSGTALRMYSGNTMTFEIPSGTTITGIDMTLASGSYNTADDDNAYTASTGTFTADPKTARTANWTGSAESSLVIGLKNEKNAADSYPQLRIVSMTIIYNAGVETKCATPKFSLAEGTFYAAQTVELTCSTADAAIMYKINDGAETEYTAPIELNTVGTYAISAYAKKADLENSETATATYVIKDPVKVGSIEEFIMNGEAEAAKTVFEWDFAVTVTKQMPSYLYVKDEAGSAMLIYGNQVPEFNQGDVIPAGIKGEYQNYNGLCEMTYPLAESFAVATETKDAKAIIMKAGNITINDQNKVILLQNVTYTEVLDGETVTSKTLDDETGSINVYYQRNWEVDNGVSGTKYDVYAAVAVYKETVQVYPIAFMAPGEGEGEEEGSVNNVAVAATTIAAAEGGIAVNAAEAVNVRVFNAAGQLVANTAVAGAKTINVPAGFYLVNAGNAVAKVVVR